MKQVKITAIRKVQHDDLMAQYENPIEHACNIEEGQTWISENGQCPEGLCPEAWKTMREFVEALAHGEGNFYDGWMRNPNSAMISCNDGFRPVSFYIETIADELQTDRLLLRRWKESDAEVLYKYASDPDVGPRAGWPAHQSIEESREVIRNVFSSDTVWAVVLKETGEPIGCMGYFTHETSNISIGVNDCEIGYWIGKPYWNQGICTEALRLMLDYCLNKKHFEHIWSDYFTGNPASGRVMEKCGFRDTGKLNRCSHLLGGDKDMVRVMLYEG